MKFDEMKNTFQYAMVGAIILSIIGLCQLIHLFEG